MNDILNRKWYKDQKPDSHKPRDALEMCLKRIDDGEIDPRHIIIAYADGTEDNSGYMQAGDLGYFGSLGLIQRIARLMQGDDE